MIVMRKILRSCFFFNSGINIISRNTRNIVFFNNRNPTKHLTKNTIRFLSSPNNICWQCKKNTNYIDQMFCEHCKSLKEPGENDDHFDILAIEKKYQIDLNDLSQKYKSLQKLLHPDKFSNRSQEEQKLSLEWSSKVNKAYATMNNPIDRAEYLLQKLGIVLSDESETKDTEFLMEMMERNEEIAEISSAKEASDVLKDIQAVIFELGLKLGKYVELNDYENAKKILIQMKYFYSLENNLKTKAAYLTGSI